MNKYKKDFPLLLNHKDLHYLDSAATSLKPFSVLESMNTYYQEHSTNVNRGVYQLAYITTDKYEAARENVAKFIDANPLEVVFTRGASSSLNLVAKSYGTDFLNEGDEVIISELEHHSSHLPWYDLAKKKNLVLKYIELDKSGRITIENFKKVLSNKTKMVAITMSSNVMGHVVDIKEITRLTHEVGAVISVDACQAICHMPISVKELDVDFLSFSGHKILGPTGVGVLYGKLELLNKMSPIEFGGDMNDSVSKEEVSYKDSPYKFETGTMPIAEIIGLSAAIDYINKVTYNEIQRIEKELLTYLKEKIKDIDGVTVYNMDGDTNLITFNIDGVHPHDAASVFDQNQVCVRAGHHCAQLITNWLGVDATLRASFYFYNDINDVDAFLESLVEARDFFNKF